MMIRIGPRIARRHPSEHGAERPGGAAAEVKKGRGQHAFGRFSTSC